MGPQDEAAVRRRVDALSDDRPKLKGTNVPADFHYYNWVDQHNVLGLGANTPIANGSNSDSLLCSTRRRVSGRRCAYRIRSASTRADWTAASTTRTAARKGARSTPTTAPASSGTSGGKGNEGQGGEIPAATRPAPR